MNLAQLRQWWGLRVPREKWIMGSAAVLVVCALLWAITVAPALRTLRNYETSRIKLDADLQTMQNLQAQAQALQSMPKLSQSTSAQALRASVVKAFGKSADFTLNGGTALVTLRNVTADALAQWLTSARTEAHSAPVQAHLTNGPAGWSGTFQMALPPS